MALTYSEYLQLERLLALQKPLSKDHDEMLFIIIHQAYELWFKEILHEVDRLQVLLQNGDSARALQGLKRVLTVLKILVAQVDILETMTPVEFDSFRDRLESASGFQSSQFRELEFALGSKGDTHIRRFPEGSEARSRLDERFQAPTLWDAFLRFLEQRGYAIPKEVLSRDVTLPIHPDAEVQKALLSIYHGDPELVPLCERLVDLDEGLQEWRYRHYKMVERTIGAKQGTGGSAGAYYLITTLFKPIYPDLWALRTELGKAGART